MLFAGLFPVETQTSTANKHPLKIHGRTYRDWQDCCRPTAALKGLRQRVSTSDGASNRSQLSPPRQICTCQHCQILKSCQPHSTTHRSLIQGNTALFAFAFSAQSSANQTQEMIPLCFHDEWRGFSAFESILDLSAQIFIWSYCQIGLSQILPGCY